MIGRNLINLLIYAIGIWIFSGFGIGAGLVYAGSCLLFLAWTLRFLCPYCYYYGKKCVIGYGWLASRLFKKREGAFGARRPFMIPAFLIWLGPLAAGTVILIRALSFLVLMKVLSLVVLLFFVSPTFMRRRGCVRCRQNTDCPGFRSPAAKGS